MTFTVAFRAAIGIPLPSNVSSLLHPAVLFESLLSASRQASFVFSLPFCLSLCLERCEERLATCFLS